MRLEGSAAATTSSGDTLVYENPGLAVWIKYSGHGLNENMAWFDYRNGEIVVKNPDQEILIKMHQIASVLGARVQSDDGEAYNAAGEVE